MADHAVIMAGGAGTRLWPLSRANRPKQLLRLFEGKSLLRHSFERLAGFLDPSRISVITAEQHIGLVRAELPELPQTNLIGEPARRDTANAVCLSACLLEARDSDGVMGVFTADHLIPPQDRFRQTLERAYAVAAQEPDALITLGLTPKWPATGYGYVQRGKQLGDGVCQVAAFKEKPDRPTAERYLADGNYYWNSGMFVWKISAITAQFARHLPDSLNALRPVAASWGGPEAQNKLNRAYPKLQRISVDYAIMEKASRVLAVHMNCQWLDVGSLTSIADAFDKDAEGNARVAPNAMCVDAANNILISEDDHLITAFGVSDLVIVHTPDATLVCRRRDAERLKELVARISDTHGSTYS